MRKIKKKFLLIMATLICMMIAEPLVSNIVINDISITNAAMKKNVTKKKKSSISKFLKPYVEFLTYPISGGDTDLPNTYKAVKFDDYYKTNMILYRELNSSNNFYSKYMNKSVKYAKKAFSSNIRKIFNKSSKFKVRKYNYQEYPSLFSNNNGKLIYWGGNWGETAIYSRVKKVYKTGKNTFLIKYNVYTRGLSNKSNTSKDYEGTYYIYLKSKGKSSYSITNIKLTERAAWSKGVKVFNGFSVKKIKCQKL